MIPELLIQQSIEGQRDAQKQLFVLLSNSLMATARRYGLEDEDCKDAVQNTFIRIFNKLETYDKQKSQFNTWCTTICIRECIALLRKNKRLNTSALDTHNIHQLIENRSLDYYDKKALHYVLDQLSLPEKMIIQMYYFDEMSHSEIANILDIRESSSRSKLSRATHKLAGSWKMIFNY